MRTPPRILIVDDNSANLDIFETRLATHGYEVVTAQNGEEALAIAEEQTPDLILLDIMMPKIDGIEVCRRIKGDSSLPFMPIILVTAKAAPKDVITGLEAGAEEYLTKPVDQTALVARVKSMLRIKELHDKTQEQARQLEEWNRQLEEKIASQLEELQRVDQLKRFFSPHLADILASDEKASFMESHRQEITVVFCDLRGFTEFSSTAEPEEQMQVLREYHGVVCPLIFQFEATLEHYAGDGVMAFFNDPVPCPDPAARAVRMAIEMREGVGRLIEDWQRRDFDLGFGVGIALGYATLGQIGHDNQFHYAAIGSVANLASRLCDEADRDQILISKRVYMETEQIADAQHIGDLTLKGFPKPVPTFNVVGLKESIS